MPVIKALYKPGANLFADLVLPFCFPVKSINGLRRSAISPPLDPATVDLVEGAAVGAYAEYSAEVPHRTYEHLGARLSDREAVDNGWPRLTADENRTKPAGVVVRLVGATDGDGIIGFGLLNDDPEAAVRCGTAVLLDDLDDAPDVGALRDAGYADFSVVNGVPRVILTPL